MKKVTIGLKREDGVWMGTDITVRDPLGFPDADGQIDPDHDKNIVYRVGRTYEFDDATFAELTKERTGTDARGRSYTALIHDVTILG